MLSAKRSSDGLTVVAYHEMKDNGPYRCPECNEPVVLKAGQRQAAHFAHINLRACELAGESDEHHRCKLAIFEGLLSSPEVSEVALERSLGLMRPDVFAVIKGVSVAIEIQISSLSIETIMRRTIQYARDDIHVLWLLQHTPELDTGIYSPSIWEKWLHACYFGRVYYWISGLDIVEYKFEPHLRVVPRKSWYSKNGKRMSAGGYATRSTRYRKPERGKTFNIARDFGPTPRYWWESNGIKVPDAKLFMERSNGRNDGNK